MANLTESPIYEPGIFQLEKSTPPLGGAPVIDNGVPSAGHANAQGLQLANRTSFLKQEVDAIDARVGVVEAGIADLDNRIDTAENNITSLQGQVSGAGSATALAEDLANNTDSAKGAALQGYDGTTTQTVLDDNRPILNYAALRTYSGRAKTVYITSPKISGRFRSLGVVSGYTDNGGTTIISINGTVWSRVDAQPVNVFWFGAVGDGVTDDANSIQAAIDYVASLPGGGVVLLSNCVGYYLSKGIIVRRHVELQGSAIFCENYQGAGPVGTRLIFALNVPLCVHVSGAVGTTDGSGTPGFRRAIVDRVAGTIPAGCEGVRVSGAANSTIEDLFVTRHAKGYRWLGKGSSTDPTLGGGLACNATRLYTGTITDVHFEIDSWPELRVTGGRAGMNGTGNSAGTSFVRITSPQGGTGGSGPNTIVFMNYQFNQGQVGPSYWLEFVNNTAGVGNQAIFEFTNCHVENISTAYIKSYANSAYIQKLQVNGGTLNTPVPLFAVDSATALNEVTFNGVDIAASTINIGSLYVNALKFSACGFTSTIATLTAPTANNWVVSMSGNVWGAAASLTLAGSGWASCNVTDVFSFDSTVTDNTGSKNVYVSSIKRNLSLWTPALQIGGSSTGITYSATNGTWQLVGRMLTLNFRIILTSKAALTGAITIGNLPFPPAGNSLDGHSGAIGYAQNFTGLTGALMLRVQDTTKLEIMQSSATGNASLTAANITNTTFVTGSITYAI